jgi:hypothetical protein
MLYRSFDPKIGAVLFDNCCLLNLHYTCLPIGNQTQKKESGTAGGHRPPLQILSKAIRQIQVCLTELGFHIAQKSRFSAPVLDGALADGKKPPSDEGGGFCEAKDGGREYAFLSPSHGLCRDSPLIRGGCFFMFHKVPQSSHGAAVSPSRGRPPG